MLKRISRTRERRLRNYLRAEGFTIETSLNAYACSKSGRIWATPFDDNAVAVRKRLFRIHDRDCPCIDGLQRPRVDEKSRDRGLEVRYIHSQRQDVGKTEGI